MGAESKLSLFAKKFMQTYAISVPDKLLEHPKLLQFLLTIVQPKPPSEKALNYARQLEKLTGKVMPEAALTDKKVLSRWISEIEIKLKQN